MNNTYFAGDHHFGHANILTFCNRPFDTIEEHNEYLVEQHNKVVGKKDTVWFLGDVAFGKDNLKYILRMNGLKRLVLGNHDRYTTQSYINVGFTKILGMVFHSEFLLSHMPCHPNQMEYRCKANIHGHMHEKTMQDPKYINVSVDQLPNYAPISLVEIRSKIKIYLDK